MMFSAIARLMYASSSAFAMYVPGQPLHVGSCAEAIAAIESTSAAPIHTFTIVDSISISEGLLDLRATGPVVDHEAVPRRHDHLRQRRFVHHRDVGDDLVER